MVARIRIERGCLAAGQALLAGSEYDVPAQVSEADALLIVRIGKAQFVEVTEAPAPAEKPPRRTAKPGRRSPIDESAQ